MSKKKTGWYRGDQVPVRDGFYEREYVFLGERSSRFHWWRLDIQEWYRLVSASAEERTKGEVEFVRYWEPCNSQKLRWRGLKKEPK